MEPKTFIDMFNDIIGKRCLFETHESAYRTETVHHFTYRYIRYEGTVVLYPMKICFDSAETDFVHISSLKSVKVVGQ